jgi:hypothetical protein
MEKAAIRSLILPTIKAIIPPIPVAIPAMRLSRNGSSIEPTLPIPPDCSARSNRSSITYKPCQLFIGLKVEEFGKGRESQHMAGIKNHSAGPEHKCRLDLNNRMKGRQEEDLLWRAFRRKTTKANGI